MRTIVTLCGSARYLQDIRLAQQLLTDAGLLVLAPPLHPIDTLFQEHDTQAIQLAWKGATFAHFHRIDRADVVFLINPRLYLGVSTTLELGYAVSRDKLVVAMQPDFQEMARDVLFDVTLATDDVHQACSALVERIHGGRP